jgi:hypothetical protein
MIIQRTVSDLLKAIESEPEVWVRFGSIMPDHVQDLTLMGIDVTARQPPPGFDPLIWIYPRALFYAGVLPGQAIGQWLRARGVRIGDITIPLSELPDDQLCQLQKRSSGSQGPNGRFPWPTVEWNIPFQTGMHLSLNEPLIGAGSTPSFIRPDVAFAAVLGMELPPGGAFDSRSSIFRQQITTARIRGVHVFPTRLESTRWTRPTNVAGHGTSSSTRLRPRGRDEIRAPRSATAHFWRVQSLQYSRPRGSGGCPRCQGSLLRRTRIPPHPD